jgi:hypothetical protein
MYEQDMTTALGCTCIFMASKILVVLTSIHIIIMHIRILPKNKFILQNSRISNKNMLKKNHIVTLENTFFVSMEA